MLTVECLNRSCFLDKGVVLLSALLTWSPIYNTDFVCDQVISVMNVDQDTSVIYW